LKAGAAEFLTKPFRDDVLLDAVRSAIDRSRAALRLNAELRAIRNCYESLTPRERDVMTLVVSGLLNKQVGGELGISEITVKAHRGQAMRKMKADSLPDLVTMAARLGLRPASAMRHRGHVGIPPRCLGASVCRDSQLTPQHGHAVSAAARASLRTRHATANGGAQGYADSYPQREFVCSHPDCRSNRSAYGNAASNPL
jgi:DNA-binding CsgD family transcriptional regulator